jgi:hypothetical protein
LRLLPALTLLWVAATWYLETRVERLVIGDTNLAVEGDFTAGLPGGPHWEYAGAADTLWQPIGGVDGGPALRLGGEVPGMLRYRLPLAYRADGYLVGLCLRAGSDAAGAPANAWAAVRRAHMPRLQTPRAVLFEAPVTDRWRCALQTVTVAFGLDELVLQVEVPADSGELWIDRVTVRPAVNPPAYRLGHTVLLVGWLVIAGLALTAVGRGLGGIAGLAVTSVGVAAAALGVLGSEGRLPGELAIRFGDCGDLLHAAAEPVFEALRVFSGDRSWRVAGRTDVVALAGLFLFGFIAAWAAMLRFRWTDRPWGRVLAYALLFGVSVPAVRLLLHAPGFGNLHWALDPLATLAGAAAGAVVAEVVLRLILRKAL